MSTCEDCDSFRWKGLVNDEKIVVLFLVLTYFCGRWACTATHRRAGSARSNPPRPQDEFEGWQRALIYLRATEWMTYKLSDSRARRTSCWRSMYWVHRWLNEGDEAYQADYRQFEGNRNAGFWS